MSKLFDDYAKYQRLAEALLTEHELPGWKLKLDGSSRRRLGRCIYEPKEIRLSLPHMKHSPEWQIEDTLRHEVAHALAYVRWSHMGHGAPWIRACVLTNARPIACAPDKGSELREQTARFELFCPQCVVRVALVYRRPLRTLMCTKCQTIIIVIDRKKEKKLPR